MAGHVTDSAVSARMVSVINPCRATTDTGWHCLALNNGESEFGIVRPDDRIVALDGSAALDLTGGLAGVAVTPCPGRSAAARTRRCHRISASAGSLPKLRRQVATAPIEQEYGVGRSARVAALAAHHSFECTFHRGLLLAIGRGEALREHVHQLARRRRGAIGGGAENSSAAARRNRDQPGSASAQRHPRLLSARQLRLSVSNGSECTPHASPASLANDIAARPITTAVPPNVPPAPAPPLRDHRPAMPAGAGNQLFVLINCLARPPSPGRSSQSASTRAANRPPLLAPSTTG